MSSVAIIGAGPAGVMASISASNNGHDVIIFEQNEKIGKKLFLTGKGRCNVTNDADTEDFFRNIPTNPKFLYSALYTFPNYSLLEFLSQQGLETKVERGGRVFPISDKSSDVIKALQKGIRQSGAKLLLNTKVESLTKNDGHFVLKTKSKKYDFDSVIVATGGISYKSTGSDGEFFKIIKSLGHNVKPLSASLIGLNTKTDVSALSGLTLKNVRAKFFGKDKLIYSEQGEMLFTHKGISGPLVLSASSYYDDSTLADAYVLLDLKPALDEKKLEARLLRDFSEYPNKDFSNIIRGYLPSSLVDAFCDKLSFDRHTKINSITKQNRGEIISLLKSYRIDIKSKGDINQAIITRGGVDVRGIDASTMQSKIVDGLYFAGEMIDVDALTGGFNLQIAFSTGYLSGLSIE